MMAWLLVQGGRVKLVSAAELKEWKIASNSSLMHCTLLAKHACMHAQTQFGRSAMATHLNSLKSFLWHCWCHA
jgi:hypothetical protein